MSRLVNILSVAGGGVPATRHRIDLDKEDVPMFPTAVRVPAFVILVVSLSFASAAARAELKFHCAFDGNRVVDRGASPAAEIVLNDDAYLTEETPGELSCYALDASSYFTYAETVGDADKIDALNEMTVTFWLNMYYNPQEGDCLISDAEPYPPYPPAGVGGWEIAVAGVGGQDPTYDNFALTFGIFESMGSYMTKGVATSPAIDASRQWVFVAVTYNAAYHQRFYLGDETSAPVQIGYITLFGDPLPDNSAALRINGASYKPLEDWSPPTHIDDVRIYDTALGVAQLDAIRLENLEDPYDPNAVPSFYGIRGYPGDGCRSAAEGVSDDGSFVVGGTSVGYDYIAFRWQGGVMTPLGDLPGGAASSTAFDVSSDGLVVVGESDSSNATWEAFRWEDGTMSPLGDLPSAYFASIAYGVSADGLVVAGYGTSGDTRWDIEAFRWEGGVMTGLGYEVDSSTGQGISADGTRIVGATVTASGYEACYWQGGILTTLGDLPGGAVGSVGFAISPDGTAIVGYSEVDVDIWEAFLWKGGQMIGLGFLSQVYRHSEAHAVSDNGRVAVGFSLNDQARQEAFIWDAVNGMRSLKAVLENDYGLYLTGWSLTRANGMSADGTVIVGTADNPDGTREAWIVRLPGPEIGATDIDLDNDTDVDIDDVNLFENCATGPSVPYDPSNLPPECPADLDFEDILSVDFDRDGDVDQDDFGGLVQPCFSGAGNTAADECRGQS